MTEGNKERMASIHHFWPGVWLPSVREIIVCCGHLKFKIKYIYIPLKVLTVNSFSSIRGLFFSTASSWGRLRWLIGCLLEVYVLVCSVFVTCRLLHDGTSLANNCTASYLDSIYGWTEWNIKVFCFFFINKILHSLHNIKSFYFKSLLLFLLKFHASTGFF